MALSERLLQAEQATGAALRESVRQTRELLEILNHAPVLARGPDGRIQFWSAGAQRLYGWDEQEAIGADAFKLLHTELPVPADEAAAALLEKGEWHAELSRRSRTGARVQVASHWILHRDAAWPPGAVIEVDNDVTEQKHAEEALRRGEARYRALVAAAAQIVWTASADGRRPLDTSQWEAFTGQTRLGGDVGRMVRGDPPRRPGRGAPRLERGRREAAAPRDGAPAPAPRRGVSQHGGPRGPGARRPRPDPRMGRRAHRHHRPGPGGGAAGPGAAAPGGGHPGRRGRARGQQPAHGGARLRRVRARRPGARSIRRRATCGKWSARPPARPAWRSSS